MGLPDLYPAQVGSPYTTLAAPYATGESTMTLVDATKLPSARGHITSLYAPAPEGEYSLGAEAFVPATLGSSNANYDRAYYWGATGQNAAQWGGGFRTTANCSLATLALDIPPSGVNAIFGFRGVC